MRVLRARERTAPGSAPSKGTGRYGGSDRRGSRVWRIGRAAARLLCLSVLLAPAILFAAPDAYSPPRAKEGFAYPDCYCTDSEGRRVELGKRACLRIGGREVTARCAMSLNNPAWRTEADGCPSV